MNPYQHSELAAEIYATLNNLIEKKRLDPTTQDGLGLIAIGIATMISDKFDVELGNPPDEAP